MRRMSHCLPSEMGEQNVACGPHSSVDGRDLGGTRVMVDDATAACQFLEAIASVACLIRAFWF
jgi:hypothetical protein